MHLTQENRNYELWAFRWLPFVLLPSSISPTISICVRTGFDPINFQVPLLRHIPVKIPVLRWPRRVHNNQTEVMS